MEYRQPATTAVELSPAESAVFYEMIAELDELIANSVAARERADEVIARSDRLVEMFAELRGQDAYLSAVRFSIGRYLPPSELSKLEEYAASIDEARDRADWSAPGWWPGRPSRPSTATDPRG